MNPRPCLPALALLVAAGLRAAGPSSAAPAVEARLLADHVMVTPGQELTLGVQLRLAPGWHVYWENPGDAGAPTRVRWRLPEGWRPGPLRWPVPEAIREAGDLLVYGYHDEVLLTSRVRVPAGLPPGTRVPVAAEVRWLACEKACIPGQAEPAGQLRVGPRALPANPALFRAWEARLPTPAGAAGSPLEAARLVGRPGASDLALELSWRGEAPAEVGLIPGPSEQVTLRAGPPQSRGRSTRIPLAAELYGAFPPEGLRALVTLPGEGGHPRAAAVRLVASE